MKYLIIIPFLFFACTNSINQKNSGVIHFDTGFSLYQDTTYVDIKGEMTHALKYQDKYYLLFAKYRVYEQKLLYIFDNEKIKKVVDCPKKMDVGYLDFFVKNDSIILKPYMDYQSYHFDTHNLIWKEIEKPNDLIFEDEKYYVYSLDFGEWGGKTWFKNKKTGIEYEIEVSTPLINRIDTTYYLTNSYSVLKIKNPLGLNKCDDNVTYKNMEASGKRYCWNDNRIGSEFVYQDTIGEYAGYFGYSYVNYYPRIITSFVWQNELLHIYETDTVTYIAKIENNSIKPIQAIGKELRFYRNMESYRCKNLNGNNELLLFQTKDEQLFGLMEIIGNKILVHYFANQAELLLGTVKADSIFVNRLNLVLSNLNNLSLKDVDLAEIKWGTFDVTPNYNIGIRGWNSDKYTIDTCKLYFIQEDSIISNTIKYFATESNGLVRSVFFEWEETYCDLIRCNTLENLANEMFKQKLFFIEDCITQKIGKYVKGKNEKIWETSNGLKIELSDSKDFRIRLVIYKK